MVAHLPEEGSEVVVLVVAADSAVASVVEALAEAVPPVDGKQISVLEKILPYLIFSAYIS